MLDPFYEATKACNIKLMKLFLRVSSETLPLILFRIKSVVRDITILKFLLENGAKYRIDSSHYLSLLLNHYCSSYPLSGLTIKSCRDILMETVEFLSNLDCGQDDLNTAFMTYIGSSLDLDVLGEYLGSRIDFEVARPRIESYIDSLTSRWYSFSSGIRKVKLLIEMGLDIDYKDNIMVKTIMHSIKQAKENMGTKLDMFLFLIDKGADLKKALECESDAKDFCLIVNAISDPSKQKILEVMVDTFGEGINGFSS